MTGKHRCLVGLDVGTSRIVALVAARGEPPDVIGIGSVDTPGARRGFLGDPDRVIESIRTAIAEAELTSGVPIEAVHLGISHAHLTGFNSRGVVGVTGGREITDNDVRRALVAATPLTIPAGREIVHVVPQNFAVDAAEDVADPIGMIGERLEAGVHVMTGCSEWIRGLVTCVTRAGLAVIDMLVEHIAASEAVLTRDEKDSGIAVVHIGTGSTAMAIYERGVLCHTAVVQVGGDHFTSDVAVGLRTPSRAAERLKCRSGCALSSMIDGHEVVDIASLGSRPSRRISSRILSDILQTRAEKLFRAIGREMAASRLPGGVVLTGGGARLAGLEALGGLVLALPVRCGCPAGIGGLTDSVDDPSFAAVVGLVKVAHALAGPAVPEQNLREHFRLSSLLALFR